MADSTYGPEGPQEPRALRWAAEMRRRRAMRRDVTWGLDTRGLSAAMRLVNSDAPAHFGATGVAVAHITCQTALILGGALQDKRSLRPREASTFRILGDLAGRAGLSDEQCIEAMEAGVQEVVATLRHWSRGCPFPDRTRAAVLTELEADARDFGEDAMNELRTGMRGLIKGDEGKAGVLLRLLDGRLADDELGAAAAAVGLDASREHGLVLLVHPRGCPSHLEAAAQDAEAQIAEVVDLGLSDTLPVSRRLVFPVMTHGRWIEARTNLHEIATKHRVLAVAPIAAPKLRDLAETYRQTERDLARVVVGCGYTSGIINPACVGPASPAEGASPAPAEDWSVEGLAPAVA